MSAVISPCGQYRYRLDRDLGQSLFGACGRVVWVMLNPSTADASWDDPTIRRVIAFSRGFGFSVATVVNLFALRSPKPSALVDADDPIGPDNDRTIAEVLDGADAVICAWGSSVPPQHHERPAAVLTLIRAAGHEPMSLGVNSDGSPRHPLYVSGSAPLLPMLPMQGGRLRHVPIIIDVDEREAGRYVQPLTVVGPVQPGTLREVKRS